MTVTLTREEVQQAAETVETIDITHDAEAAE